MSKSNNTLIIATALVIIAIIASFTVIFIVDVSDRGKILTSLPAVGAFVMSILTAMGVKLVKTGTDKAVEQTNGSLDKRIHTAVTKALAESK